MKICNRREALQYLGGERNVGAAAWRKGWTTPELWNLGAWTQGGCCCCVLASSSLVVDAIVRRLKVFKIITKDVVEEVLVTETT